MTLDLELLIPFEYLYDNSYFKTGVVICRFGQVDVSVYKHTSISNEGVEIEMENSYSRYRYFDYNSQDARALLSQITKLSSNIITSYEMAIEFYTTAKINPIMTAPSSLIRLLPIERDFIGTNVKPGQGYKKFDYLTYSYIQYPSYNIDIALDNDGYRSLEIEVALSDGIYAYEYFDQSPRLLLSVIIKLSPSKVVAYDLAYRMNLLDTLSTTAYYPKRP